MNDQATVEQVEQVLGDPTTVRERLWADVARVIHEAADGERTVESAAMVVRDMCCRTHRGHWVAEMLDDALDGVHWDLLLELLVEEAGADPMGAKEFVDWACDGGFARALFQHTALPAADRDGYRWAVEVGDDEIAVFTDREQAEKWARDHYLGRGSLRRIEPPREVSMPEQSDHKLRCGDHVKHEPSGENWVVAWADYGTGNMSPCGWPQCEARIEDCTLTKACGDEEHRWWVEQWKDSSRSDRHKVLGLYGDVLG